ncbi:MAG: hypothetical protein ACOCUS_02420 [Polyangiales bacterium]
MTSAEQTAAEGAPGVDPELEALPAPAPWRRLAALTLMALVVVASVALLLSLRADIGYFFASDDATSFGEATEVEAATLEPNTFVRVQGTPMAAGTVRYRTFLGTQKYAVFPLAGQRTVFVQVPIEDLERSRDLARREFSGRLVTFGQLGGRMGTVRGYLEEQMGLDLSSETFLLMADEPPSSYGWALGLAALCVLFVLVNLWLAWRWFRPLPAAEPNAREADQPNSAK